MRRKRLQNIKFESHRGGGVYFLGGEQRRLTLHVLEEGIMRVCYLPDGQHRTPRTWMIAGADDMPREGRMRADMARFDRAPHTVKHLAGDCVTATTESLSVTVDLETAALRWHTATGELFAADVPRRGYVDAGELSCHYMQLRADTCFYGFGERAGPLNKRGMRMEMRNLDALGYSARTTDPLYKHFPVYIAYLPELNLAYGLLYDNLATTVFDMGKEIDAVWGPYVKYEVHGGDLDYYFLFGPTIEDVTEKIAYLTGYPFLPPRWSLGYLGSTMSYTEAPDAQEQLKQFAALTRQHGIPCDGFHLSSGYTTDADGVRNVFNWNRDRIPKPKKMVEDFHRFHIRLLANVKPYILEMNPHYAACVEAGCFVKDPATKQHYTNRFWSGGAYESAEGAYLDFTSAPGYDWWQAQLQSSLFDYGVDAIWNDNNEFEIWDDAVLCDGFGSPFPVGWGRPLQTLLMGHASFYATQAHAPGRRPFVLSRSGCPGIQRYAQMWSGDNHTSWEALQYNIPMGLGLGLSGAPNIGHDVGGFHGDRPSPELFTRWVQNGVLHPRFTIHSWNTDGTVNEPWMYPEVLVHIREAIKLRYRLLPYLYSLFVEAHRYGHPIIRPMVYHYAEDPQTHDTSFDFMLGRHILVASVLEADQREREVYLPAGTGWYDFYTGDFFKGGQVVTLQAPLSRIPLLVPEGGIVPMGPVMQYVGEATDDIRDVYLFPHREGRGTSTFTLAEDDGLTLDYASGGQTRFSFVMQSDPEVIRLVVQDELLGYTLPYKQLHLILPPGETRSVRVEGKQTTEQVIKAQRVISFAL